MWPMGLFLKLFIHNKKNVKNDCNYFPHFELIEDGIYEENEPITMKEELLAEVNKKGKLV